MDLSIAVISKLFLSPLMWVMIIFAMLLVGVGGLWLRKQRKLEYKCLVLAPAGNNKISFKLIKAGWFKEKMLFKLWDYGKEELIKTSDGRKVYGIQRDQMHFFKGSRCLVCWEKGDDRKVLVPISDVMMGQESKNALLEIAPVDLRDVSSQIIQGAETELAGRMDKIMQWVMLGGTIMFAFISIILIVQMVKNGQTEASKLILEAGKVCGRVVVAPGVSP